MSDITEVFLKVIGQYGSVDKLMLNLKDDLMRIRST